MEQVTIPMIAYGTWVENYSDAPSMLNRVEQAINLGYTHIDTAKNYGTEQYVIQAIKDFPRSGIYLTSKVRSIIELNVDDIQYYDLLLLHYPPLNTHSRDEFKYKVLELWIGMNSYMNMGITKAIGVSNFYQNHLDLLLEVCQEYNLRSPSINQIEIHPGNLELEYVPYMQEKGIIPFAHTPLGGLGSQYVLNNDILIDIGKRINATAAQVVIAYLIKRGIGVVTSSKDINRMKESIQAVNFLSYLTDQDMNNINATDMGMGPLIHGAQYAYTDNHNLY